MIKYSVAHCSQYFAILFCSLFFSLFTIFLMAFPHWGTMLAFVRLVAITTIICSPAVMTLGFLSFFISEKLTIRLGPANTLKYRLVFFAILLVLPCFIFQTNAHLFIGSFQIDLIWPIVGLLITFVSLFEWFAIIRQKKATTPLFLTSKKA